MEQPTVFYAVAIALAIGGLGGGLNAQIAWAYVALRILHSLVQATVNRVMVRFAIFALASLALIALSLHAFMGRSEEHTSELQSLMRISYAVFCLKKTKNHNSTV